jgi:25S rRNA (adenine2142-N1)-methyltransferase
MASRKKRQMRKSLSSGRPPFARKHSTSLSSKATKSIIRNHHQLRKRLSQTIKAGDTNKAKALQHELRCSGGLNSYQQASITGQSSIRGGDSSKILMQWLEESNRVQRISHLRPEKLRMLEVGALSPDNTCSRSGRFAMERIDLNSQHPDIKQQDFMDRPIPLSDKDKFDIFSLSLVLNFVPDAEARGDMLRRTCSFLRLNMSMDDHNNVTDNTEKIFPCLFVVLPKPCVTNSRYLTEDHLERIMESLGYAKAKVKLSAKLYYSLWTFTRQSTIHNQRFAKVEVNPGKSRNNFCIVCN